MDAHNASSHITDDDIYLFNEGSHFRLYEKLGARLVKQDGNAGTYFAVWAPNADFVSVIGEFNEWNKGSHRLHPRGQSGIWEGFIPTIGKGTLYKYHIGSPPHAARRGTRPPRAVFL